MSFKYMRRSFQGIQVPRLTFRNDKDHNVIVQGMVHIGDKSFYEKLLKDFDAFDGEIHLEGVSNKNNAQSGEVLKHFYSLLASAGNFSLQKEYINKKLINASPDKFKNYDLDFEDISSEIEKILESVDELVNDIPEVEKIFTNSLFMRMVANPFVWSIRRGKNSSLINKEIILDQRNDYAMSKVLGNSNDVMLIWGAAHISGMSKILIDNEYNLVNMEWDTIMPWVKKNKVPSEIRKMTIKRELDSITKILDNMNND